MVTVNDAISIVRNKHPNDLIRDYFVYDGHYIFSISIGKRFIPEDTSIFYVSINSENGKYDFFDFWYEMLNNKDPELDKAIENSVYVDITKAQAETI